VEESIEHLSHGSRAVMKSDSMMEIRDIPRIDQSQKSGANADLTSRGNVLDQE